MLVDEERQKNQVCAAQPVCARAWRAPGKLPSSKTGEARAIDAIPLSSDERDNGAGGEKAGRSTRESGLRQRKGGGPANIHPRARYLAPRLLRCRSPDSRVDRPAFPRLRHCRVLTMTGGWHRGRLRLFSSSAIFLALAAPWHILAGCAHLVFSGRLHHEH